MDLYSILWFLCSLLKQQAEDKWVVCAVCLCRWLGIQKTEVKRTDGRTRTMVNLKLLVPGQGLIIGTSSSFCNLCLVRLNYSYEMEQKSTSCILTCHAYIHNNMPSHSQEPCLDNGFLLPNLTIWQIPHVYRMYNSLSHKDISLIMVNFCVQFSHIFCHWLKTEAWFNKDVSNIVLYHLLS